MKTACPNCGAEVEFRYDDSFVRICSHCKNAIARTDRGVDSLGKVADLAPIESPLKLFSGGHFGSATFLLVGMAQIRHHAGGIWQEWYAKLDGGKWGWLAEAQGNYYLTFEEPWIAAPGFAELAPGRKLDIPVHGVPRRFTVAEATSATYVGAAGELPFRLVPAGGFRYADLADGQGTVATIDYGEEGDTPSLYVGHQVTLDELKITGGEAGPSREPQITSQRLACPNCNAPIEIHVPDQTQRVVCAHCNHLVSVDGGVLQVLAKLATKATPAIPLGSKGTFAEGEMTVIGYVQRSAEVEQTWWPFDEYLLFAPKVGFRWLVESDGHWSYVQPVAAGAVEEAANGATYDGVTFRSYQTAPLRVDQVLGEFYWQVAAGETVESEDLVAPPAMLSRESSPTELTWSLGTYLTTRAVQRAFGNKELPLGSPQGVAPNQVDSTGIAGSYVTLGFVALLIVGIGAAMIAPEEHKFAQTIEIKPGVAVPPPADPLASPNDGPPATPADPQPNEFFSEPFQLDGGRNIELAFDATLDNNWAYAGADLVNVDTGVVVSVDVDLEYYSGVEEGDFWSEGSRHTTAVISPQPEGTYLLRLETQQGSATADVPLTIGIRQGVFRGRYLGLACIILGIPLIALGLHTWSFEKRRWENSPNKPPRTPIGIVMLLFTGVFLLIGGLFKALGNSSND